jgi:hypothetical protein
LIEKEIIYQSNSKNKPVLTRLLGSNKKRNQSLNQTSTSKDVDSSTEAKEQSKEHMLPNDILKEIDNLVAVNML